MQAESTDSFVLRSRFLESCEIPLEDYRIEPFTVVIFGGAGDLTRRMLLPTLYHLYHSEKLIENFSIIGFGLPAMSDEAYRSFAGKTIEEFGHESLDRDSWDTFARNLFYISGDLGAEGSYEALYSRLHEFSASSEYDVIYYCAVPPGVVPMIVDNLDRHNLCKGPFNTRILVEKPFGEDRRSATELNQLLLKAFEERQIYRIDHYLGKETVQNIIFFRFANSIFEPLWNRSYVDHVQITVAEDIGVGNRGVFYEQAGVVRDIVQNHILQLIALVAMDPPVGFAADYIRNEKVKIFNTIRPMNDAYIDEYTVRGQYGSGKIDGNKVPAYREEENVAFDSNTPTFFAGKFYIDNWRWAGVPFYVRVGKRLAKRITEISIEFKKPPLRLVGRDCDIPEPDRLVIGIQPQEEISLRFGVKYPGAGNRLYPVDMVFNYQTAFHIQSHPAYERLLMDCVRGDLTLFARQDGVEAMWSVVDPIITRWEDVPATNFPDYPAGSWGPKEADELIERDGRTWRAW
jgi:glucose-6-phosphate 1-dehydrogenase